MKFSRLISLVLCFALLLTACACSGEKTAEKKRIAVIAKAVDSDFWHNVKNGVESAATEYNVSVTFEGPENESDYEEQNRLIKQAIDDKVDAIVLSAIDYSKSNDIVDEAARSGL